jgi:hypothetical protein
MHTRSQTTGGTSHAWQTRPVFDNDIILAGERIAEAVRSAVKR